MNQSSKDDWGNDPQVQNTRQYFGRMEKMDRLFLSQTGISPFDQRLKNARQLRLRTFEKTCRRAVKNNIDLDENTWTQIFCLCQDLAYKKYGLITSVVMKCDRPEILKLVMENFS